MDFTISSVQQEYKKQILPLDCGFVIKNLLDNKECDKIINDCEAIGFQLLPTTSLVGYRTNTRLSFEFPLLTRSIFKRLGDFIPKIINYQGKNWSLNRINESVRVCKYEKGQYFNKHIDGHWENKDKTHV